MHFSASSGSSSDLQAQCDRRRRTRILLAAAITAALGAAFVAACSSSPANPPPTLGPDGGSDGGADTSSSTIGPDSSASSDVATSLDAGAVDTGEDVFMPEDSGADWLVPPNIPRDAGESTLAPLRQSCAFEAGAWPAQTVGNDYPIGSDIPINHILVIMQENRSFDHYLGRLVTQGYYSAGDFTTPPDGGTDDAGDASAGSGFAHSDQVDVDPTGWAVPDADGGLVPPHPDNEYCYGVDHSWGGQHNDWDNGLNDGFVKQNNPDGQRTMFYQDDSVIPFYYALADTFSIGDRYFCSVLSSTWPNRFFLMAGTSFGIGDNSACPVDTVANPAPQIFLSLEAGGHTWMDYTDGPHMEEFFPNFGFGPDALAHYGNVTTGKCNLFSDIRNGTLPDVGFMMGDEVSQFSDEGPSNLPGIGGHLVEEIIRALWESPSWKDTAVFITYDENGGLADHVPPAPACEPDGYVAQDGNGTALSHAPGTTGFNQTGFRVPFYVVSPYAKKHFVSHLVHDHSSILRFIETRFGLPALTGRDANSTPPMEMFDFQNPPFMTPPTITATTSVAQSILTQCNETLPPSTCYPDGGTQ
jgi:phospholipase C